MLRCRLLSLPVLATLLLTTTPATAADWWVDGANGNDTGPGSRSSPFRNIFWGLHVAQPGDTVHVLPTTTYGPVYIARSGEPGAPITLLGAAAASSYVSILASDTFGIQVAPGTSWITIGGFDVRATGDRTAIYLSRETTHVVVQGNYAHDSGDAGIAAVGTDYLTVSGNVVARNARNGATACLSGISVYQLRDTDGATSIKNEITGNVVFGNTNAPGAGCDDSDGNGIIVDDSRNTQGGSTYGPYPGATLVADNVVFGNGGRGIDVFESDNVGIVDNTLFHDNQDPFEQSWKPGEIMLSDSGGLLVMNNVAWGDGVVDGYNFHAEISVESCSGEAVIIDNNLLWDDAGLVDTALFAPVSGSHLSTATLRIGSWDHWNRWANPDLVSASLDPGRADFRLQAGSPGAGLGNPTYTMPTDILGAPAPVHPTVGAYEATVHS